MATFNNFQVQGYLSTEAEMQKIWKLIEQDYLQASKAASDELARIYAKYMAGVKPDDYYNVMLQYNRLENVLDSLEHGYIDAAKRAGVKIGASGELAVSNNFYRQRYTLSFIDGDIDLKFGIINPYLVEASVYGTADAWKKIQTESFNRLYGNPKLYTRAGTLTDTLTKNNAETIARLRQTLTNDLLLGKGYRETSKDVINIIGSVSTVDGKKVYTGGLAQALTVTRTEGNRNLNAGNLASTNSARAEGLEIQRSWLATLDGRTRPAHAAADGQKENADGNFTVGGAVGSYPGGLSTVGQNVNCRCTVIDIVDGQAPLGRRGKDPLDPDAPSKVFGYKTYGEYMTENGMNEDNTGKWVKK